jgi:ABC-type antimicrobial peptide transport system permease subunit
MEVAAMSYMNEAGWDRILRIVIGIIMLYLGWAGVVTGGLGLVLIVVGFIFLITGLVGWCPLYRLLKIRTNKAVHG